VGRNPCSPTEHRGEATLARKAQAQSDFRKAEVALSKQSPGKFNPTRLHKLVRRAACSFAQDPGEAMGPHLRCLRDFRDRHSLFQVFIYEGCDFSQVAGAEAVTEGSKWSCLGVIPKNMFG
jgi:hypothetical protein